LGCSSKTKTEKEDAVQQFVSRFGDGITGFLSGFDRLVFRGACRKLGYVEGLSKLLGYEGVLLRDFGAWVERQTQRLKAAISGVVTKAGRPVRYLPSAASDKEALAREYLRSHPVESGAICLLTAVEPCQSFELYRCRRTKRLELQPRWRKCLHAYVYFRHPRLGFGHVRYQTWLPFGVRICLNGREWLARELDAAGLAYQRADNVFLSLEDPVAAQRLVTRQLQTSWPRTLEAIARQFNPLHGALLERAVQPYYWTTHQMEWATDIYFRRAADLQGLYPRWIRHALSHLGSEDVLRFLGKRLTCRFEGQVTSDYRRRPEGVRVKHRVGLNSVKMYDKAPHVLRVETTIHDVSALKTFRPKEGDPHGPRDWRTMRRGVADLHRLAHHCQASNERYLAALAAVHPDDATTLQTILDTITRSTTSAGRRFRALRPFHQDDTRLLEAAADAAFLVTGFRNRDLRSRLHPNSPPDSRRRLASRVGRQLRLLRAHRLVRKVQGTHRYLLTQKGRLVCTALLAARDASLAKLTAAA
jgi:hypothetical protein